MPVTCITCGHHSINGSDHFCSAISDSPDINRAHQCNFYYQEPGRSLWTLGKMTQKELREKCTKCEHCILRNDHRFCNKSRCLYNKK